MALAAAVIHPPPATCNTDPDDPGRYILGGETYLLVESDEPGQAIGAGAEGGARP